MNRTIFESIAVLSFLSLFLLSGCAANKQAATQTEVFFEKEDYCVFENNQITDPALKIIWKSIENNPTTFYRYTLENPDGSYALPTLDQLSVMLQKISFQLGKNKDLGNVRSCHWFDEDCYFLSSSTLRTNEGEMLYEVYHWDAAGKKSSKEMVTGGDLVTILLVSE